MTEKFDAKRFLKNLTGQPGIYQMLSAEGEVLYVGKAQNLKRRVTSYFRKHTNNPRITSLVKQIVDIKIIVTHSDNEAFLLENNLIKQLKPRYNIIFRDDKSYAYIVLSKNHPYPRLDFYRGKKNEEAHFYGPFTNAWSVRESLNFLQKLFKIRQCTNSYFKNRQRPCIQYQIQRCTAPCVGYISAEEYQQQVRLAKLFLEGKSSELITVLSAAMQKASDNLQYEDAKHLRDQITGLRKLQEKQYVYSKVESLDVIVIQKEPSLTCIQMMMFRHGKLCSNRHFFPKEIVELEDAEILESFISQHYQEPLMMQDLPAEILTNIDITNKEWLEKILAEIANHKVAISQPKRGERVKFLEMALTNAQESIKFHLVDKTQFTLRLQAIQQDLQLEIEPALIECFDISHLMGEATKASCVVFNQAGADKRQYRRYNINDITPGDDYAAMQQVLGRRYQKFKQEQKPLPDIVMIDGGKGQLQQAIKVFQELAIHPKALLAIAKGPERKAGLETIYRALDQQITIVNISDPGLLLLQQIRDESHRFALLGHRKQRDKRRVTSHLQMIPGIGAQRRKMLLHYFGGLQEIKRASINEIAKVPGLSLSLAKIIYDFLHQD